jgi:hypothetical protein
VEEVQELSDGKDMPLDQRCTVEFITRWHSHKDSAVKFLGNGQAEPQVLKRVLILNYVVSTRCFGIRCNMPDEVDAPITPDQKLQRSSRMEQMGLQHEEKSGAEDILVFAWAIPEV